MFNKTNLVTIIAMGTTMAEAMGIPLKRNMLETAEDFDALVEVGERFAELNRSNAELCRKGVSIDRVNAITADAMEFKDAIAAAKTEIKDRTLGSSGEKPATAAKTTKTPK